VQDTLNASVSASIADKSKPPRGRCAMFLSASKSQVKLYNLSETEA
jgi:hypothetical protein